MFSFSVSRLTNIIIRCDSTPRLAYRYPLQSSVNNTGKQTVGWSERDYSIIIGSIYHLRLWGISPNRERNVGIIAQAVAMDVQQLSQDIVLQPISACGPTLPQNSLIRLLVIWRLRFHWFLLSVSSRYRTVVIVMEHRNISQARMDV